MKCIAVILSGGTGSRMNMDMPKQYIEVNDRMIITESIRPFMECALVSGIRIVADEMWHDRIMDEYSVLSEYYMGGLDVSDCGMDDRDFMGAYKLHGFSKPGDNRQLSILNALRDIAGNDNVFADDIASDNTIADNTATANIFADDIASGNTIADNTVDHNNVSHDTDSINEEAREDILVIIHDAARPLVSAGLITRCIEACDGHDGVMPVLPMKDTVYYSDDGRGISKLLNRDRVFAGQAPEVFRLTQYLKACEALMPDKIMDIRGSTEPAVMAGLDVVMIPGEEGNFKITTREDLEHYKELLKNMNDNIV